MPLNGVPLGEALLKEVEHNPVAERVLRWSVSATRLRIVDVTVYEFRRIVHAISKSLYCETRLKCAHLVNK